MKKYFAPLFFSFLIIFSSTAFAQVDSSRIASAERQMAKDQKKADKLAKKAKRQERKQKRHEQKMERKERKRQRTLNKIEKSERKIDDMRRDSTRTSAFMPVAPVQTPRANTIAYGRNAKAYAAWKKRA